MRIAIIVDAFPSLSETFISNKAERLAGRGNEVVVFCTKKNRQLFAELFEKVQNIRVVSFNKNKIWFYLLIHPAILFRALKEVHNFPQNIYRFFRISLINYYHPDIIHFEFSGVGIDYLSEMKFLKGRKVVSCRGSAEKVKLLVYTERKEKFRKLLSIADAIHCVSMDIRETILPYCNKPEKIFVNYPSIDTQFFQKGFEKHDDDFITILSVGRLTFQKGYLIGLLTAQELKQRGLRFKWLIAGSGQGFEELVFQIHELKLNEHIVLLGAKTKEEIKNLMQKSDIFFLPSVYEGVANVVLEAMSMELPVVATKSGGMAEVITHQQNGLLADIYDDVSLADNLEKLATDSELRICLGKAARKRVVESFELEKQIDKFEIVYHNILNANHAEEDGVDKNIVKEKELCSIYTSSLPQRRLKIGIVVPQFPSYTETFFLSKITGLCDRNHTVTVFCNVYNKDRLLRDAYDLHHYQNLKVVALDFNKLSDAFFQTIFSNPFILLRNFHVNRKKFLNNLYYDLCKLYFKKSNCDLYHFGYSGLAASYLPLLKDLPGKVVVSCLGTAENIKPLSEQGRSEKLKVLFDSVDRIHCVTDKMRDTVMKYGADCKKIFINRPAIDVKAFSRRKEYGFRERIKIISVGRLVFQKGFLVGILAVGELRKRFENFTWTIIGDGPEREQLIFHINALGLKNHVHLTGKKLRDEVIQFYEDSDILLLPSVSEGLANVILEAMAMELPVVSSINGGVAEVITHDVNGILVPNYDYHLMSCELYRLCMNFDKRKQLGQAGRDTVKNSFALKRYLDVFEEEYLKLV